MSTPTTPSYTAGLLARQVAPSVARQARAHPMASLALALVAATVAAVALALVLSVRLLLLPFKAYVRHRAHHYPTTDVATVPTTEEY